MNKIIIFISGFILMACQRYPMDVRKALELSGENRNQLEKVLMHYKDNKLKYRAACFLISNMPYHRTNIEIEFDEQYFSYFERVDSIYTFLFHPLSIEEIDKFDLSDFQRLSEAWAEEFEKLPKPRYLSGKQDLFVIDADFLIDNIEEAFYVWENNPLIKSMDFETFKEFILPYRALDESLVFKRSELRQIMESHLLIDGTDSVNLAIERYRVLVKKCRWFNQYINFKEDSGPYVAYLPWKSDNCLPLTTWTTNFFRSAGIPVVFEYTNQWRDRNRRHYWCASPDNQGVVKPYTVHNNNLMQDWDISLKKAPKVYRINFGKQKSAPCFLAGKDEFIPNQLSSPLISDETYRYAQTITLKLPFSERTNNKLVYLGQFTRDGFNPVGWGVIDKKKREAVFEQVPTNAFFFPFYYDSENNPVLFGLPFSINSDGMVEAIPAPMSTNLYPVPTVLTFKDSMLFYSNTNEKVDELSWLSIEKVNPENRINLHLTRKFPDKVPFILYREMQVGAYFYGYNDDASKIDTLYKIKSTPYSYYQEITFSHTGKYKHYGFRMQDHVDTKEAHIGEMAFLGPYDPTQDCIAPVPLPVFELSDTLENYNSKLWEIRGIPTDSSAQAFDRNVLTTVLSNNIEVEYKTPALVTHVRFIPRNGNNMVVPNNTYELYYFDKGWKFFDRKEAQYNFLDFCDVPANTLYWLKNITEGEEELPFFYINGNQYFLNHDLPFIEDIPGKYYPLN